MTFPRESSERAAELVQSLRSYAERHVRSQLWDERRSFPPYVVTDLGRMGLFGMVIPETLGGLPLRHADVMHVVEQLAAIDTTLAGLVGVSLALGARPIARHAARETQERYLPELARGTMLGGLALTEPGAGSDPRAIRARGEPVPPGRVRLSGVKSWIGNGSWSGVVNVFVRLGAGQRVELAGFCVPREAEGLVQGPEALTMGMRAMVQNELRLEGVVVAESERLGAPSRGLDVLSDTLSYGRLGICAIALGAMKRSLQIVHRYAGRRRVSTGLLLSHPDVRRYFLESVGAIEIASSILSVTCARLDRDERVEAPWSLAAKIVVPELAFAVIDGAMQRLGARGYIETNTLPRIFRDARLLRIFEGPTEALASHLGALALADPTSVTPLLAPNDAVWMDEHVARARELLRRPTADKRDLVLGLSHDLGVWCAHALLAAGCAGEHGRAVLAARCEIGRRALVTRLEGRAQSIDLADIEALATALRGSIGDLDPHTWGEDHARDPLLARAD